MEGKDSAQWIAQKFRQYYTYAKPDIPELARREFGFGGWEKKIEFRHLSFENPLALHDKLRNDAPLYVSASAAYYQFPSARPMPKKNWLGADIIFDLDAEPDEISPFIRRKTLEGIREKAQTLVEEYLIPDFGLSSKELQVNFSGSRGYHVRAYKKEAQMLGRQERREIVDYIEGGGLDFESFFFSEPVAGSRFERLIGPSPSMGGFKGKFAKRIIKMIKEPLTAAQISPKLKNELNASRMIEGINKGNWSAVYIPRALEVFRAIFVQTSLKLTNQVETDANVTIDTSKILRMPDTLHGGSGLIAKTLPINLLSSFSPLEDAIAFSKTKTEEVVCTQDIAEQEFAGKSFEKMQKGQKAQLPECYAVYLVCKKAATPA